MSIKCLKQSLLLEDLPEMGRGPHNAHTESAGQSKSLSVCCQPLPVFFLPVKVGVSTATNICLPYFLLFSKSFLIKNNLSLGGLLNHSPHAQLQE